MKLSIIIVNYNVKFFIEQCLFSVQEAIKGIEAEVFVVDNNSVDGSCELIKEKFPQVILIENKENTGFSKANNQAIRIAKGEYILLLNPDTVVTEKTFSKVIEFMDSHPDGGGLGVKMIDGKGKFLPESKRGVPTPMVAFFKMFGFSKLFPKSKIFSRYHLGYLDKDQIHEIEILSGAFMFMRKSVIDEIGMLDEDYFMYGEDIDLSYRIIKAGYKNYYYPETTIIHYKGESTKKGSVNYVLIFYKAMIIFARKQLSSKHSKVLSLLINLAIFIRAFAAIATRITKQTLLPVLDASMIYISFRLLIMFWEKLKFGDLYFYPQEYYIYIIPLFILIYFISLFFAGAYERQVKLLNAVKGVAAGFLAILIVYSLLNEGYRYSRALVLMGGAASFLIILLNRILLHFSGIEEFRIKLRKSKKIILAGEFEETERVRQLLLGMGMETNILGFVGPDKNKTSESFLGEISQLREIIQIYKVDEIIFCMRDISTKQIISHMLQYSDLDVDFKIAPPETISIIGSNSINTAGELYTLDFNSIAKTYNKRKKRIFDISFSVICIVSFPLLVFIVRKPSRFFINAIQILAGFKTWISFNEQLQNGNIKLPFLKKGVLAPVSHNLDNNDFVLRANILYAKDYTVTTDLLLIIKNFRELGS